MKTSWKEGLTSFLREKRAMGKGTDANPLKGEKSHSTTEEILVLGGGMRNRGKEKKSLFRTQREVKRATSEITTFIRKRNRRGIT